MLNEKEDPNILENVDGGTNKGQMSRSKFFLITFFCGFLWYLIPGYLFQILQSISWVCWVFPRSVTAHQIGSGWQGLGVGALTLDWSTTAFLSGPLVSPFFAIANVFIGYFGTTYIMMPICYWVLNVYNAKTFPINSMGLLLELDTKPYRKQGRIHLSLAYVFTFGFSFATLASTVTHVALFYGREIYECYWASSKAEKDIHTKLMKSYKEVPSWWFYFLLAMTKVVSVSLCIFLKKEIQMPFWAILLAAALAFSFTLPISIITATTNQTPGLNIITEYIMGVIYPGKSIANVCFKVYGYISMVRAISFLSDFKLGHYMKIPPRSIFLVQLVGAMIANTLSMIVAWWLLHLDGICNPDKFSNSPWTCPTDHIFFDASIIWGLIGSKRILGNEGNYSELNWFFLGGLLGPIVVWGCHKAFPKYSWIPLINLPVILGVAGNMPYVSGLTYNSWIFVGTIFNFLYNYVLSAALEAGVAFMVVFLYFTVGIENTTISWWGNNGSERFEHSEHCDLASCPTAKGVTVDRCPVF
ncbi:hypothetical protein CDL12_04820 [Handroanthus impetiginosus]|uniref:Sexual differentiation process protein ISP4 n=1 Tax=Handroanthus impetiginosus TaxID=429701 RepID=A0A2G9HY91_9LAMI|nr:hypothetical protein CDL12_04820 [Handroanthus impetiginosus]